VRHGGYIVVDYDPDKDIYVKVYLPEIYEVLTVEEKKPEPTPRVEEATILLVEDDAIVLFVNKTRLERLGYKVITATAGEMALDIFEQHAQDIQLVISDIIMPGISGMELFTRLKRQKPDVKMVLATGCSIGHKDENLLNQGIADFIQKPFSREQLAEVVRETLQKSG
jgi:DNA-binding NtrC family response regulator